MTCRELTELVTDYVEGKMPLLARVRFQVHLGTCKNCRAYLAQMKATIGALGALGESADVPAPPMPADVEAELLARFRNFKR